MRMPIILQFISFTIENLMEMSEKCEMKGKEEPTSSLNNCETYTFNKKFKFQAIFFDFCTSSKLLHLVESKDVTCLGF